MKSFFGILTLVICLSSMRTGAQAEIVALYGDSLETGTCDGSQFQPQALAIFYIFHYSSSGATGSRFAISPPNCLTFGGIIGPFLFQPAFPSTGTLETGIEFNYGACLSGWIYIGVVGYWDLLGLTSGFCCEHPILPHPSASSGQVEAMDCSNSPKVATAHSGIVGVNESCPCSVVTGIRGDRQTTWGAIKSLYADG